MDLSPEILASLEKVAGSGIQLLPLPQIQTHFVFERDGFVSLVERRKSGFGSIGAPGLLTKKGFAPLVTSDGESAFVTQNFRQPATVEQVASIRTFLADLKSALS